MATETSAERLAELGSKFSGMLGDPGFDARQRSNITGVLGVLAEMTTELQCRRY